MTSDIKLCKDCKHFITTKSPHNTYSGDKCHKEFSVDVVTGGVTYQSARLLRISPHHCGTNGAWWEAAPVGLIKPSIWQRFKTFLTQPGTSSAVPGGPTSKDIAKLPCLGRQGGPR
jgi:hypothetical protein